MDTSDEDIVFDSSGLCNHCSSFIQKISHITPSKQQEIELVQLIKKKGLGKKYDCVIGVSGGLDSSYLAYWAHSHQLKPLLVHLDNGWNSEVSVQNIRKIATSFQFDFESVVLKWEDFKDLQIAFLKSSIVDIELPTDLAIPAVLHNVASKHGVKCILSGGNYASEGILPLTWGYHVLKDMRLYRYIVRNFAKQVKHNIPTFGIWDETYYKLFKGIKTYYPLNLIHYNLEEAKHRLAEIANCEFPIKKHHESRYTRFWQSYIMPVKFDFDYRKATFSTLICHGKMTKPEAEKQLEESPYYDIDILKEKSFICKKLGLSEDEFDAIMKLPPKTYKDFPNSHRWIQFVHGLYKFLKGKK